MAARMARSAAALTIGSEDDWPVEVGVPIIAYNNPFDTKVDLVPPLLAQLFHEGLIVGVKEFTGDVRRYYEIAELAPGLDILAGPFTAHVGSITDRALVRRSMAGAEAVFHAATLHKPHVATHSRQDFVDTNITGTLNLLEEAVAARVGAFVYTSTTSVFGDALVPPPGAPMVAELSLAMSS